MNRGFLPERRLSRIIESVSSHGEMVFNAAPNTTQSYYHLAIRHFFDSESPAPFSMVLMLSASWLTKFSCRSVSGNSKV